MEWRKVIYKGMETTLLVNEYGNVFNFKTQQLLKPNINTNGYVSVAIPKVRLQYRVHRIVAEAFIPNPNNYPYVNHIDGNKLNNRVENLEWCTAKMNTQHAEAHHLVKHAFGERSGSNKYSEKQIHQVCQLLEKGVPGTEVARLTGVSRTVVKGVKFGEIWKHIFRQYNIPQIRRKTYPELNALVDTLLDIGKSRKFCVDKLMELIDSRKLAGQIVGRRIRQRKKELQK